jgi:hypothetical protein
VSLNVADPQELQDLIDAVDALLSRLGSPANGTVEWYLRNHLRDYRGALHRGTSKRALGNATRLLSRFCVEHMDFGEDLYRECNAITAFGSRLAHE